MFYGINRDIYHWLFLQWEGGWGSSSFISAWFQRLPSGRRGHQGTAGGTSGPPIVLQRVSGTDQKVSLAFSHCNCPCMTHDSCIIIDWEVRILIGGFSLSIGGSYLFSGHGEILRIIASKVYSFIMKHLLAFCYFWWHNQNYQENCIVSCNTLRE